MSKHRLIQELEQGQLKKDGRVHIRVGDTVSVHTRIIEGQKERIQVFTGTVIARKGTGLSETFSMHRVAYGEGMERVFPLHSPRIAKIEVLQEGDVRRGKLYHLRGTQGKKARVKKRVGPARKLVDLSQEKLQNSTPHDHAEEASAKVHALQGNNGEANLNKKHLNETSQPEVIDSLEHSSETEKAPASAE